MIINTDENLRKFFRTSYKISGVGLAICLVSILDCSASLVIWKSSGAMWSRYAGSASFILAFIGILIALTAQSAHQGIRFVAKKKGKKPDFFRNDESPSLWKQAQSGFDTMKRVLSCNVRYKTLVNLSNCHTRNNARVAHSPCNHVSRRSKDSSNNGDPDQGEPPKPPYPVAFSVTHSKLNRKPNNISSPWLHLGCCRLPCRKTNSGRWSA